MSTVHVLLQLGLRLLLTFFLRLASSRNVNFCNRQRQGDRRSRESCTQWTGSNSGHRISTYVGYEATSKAVQILVCEKRATIPTSSHCWLKVFTCNNKEQAHTRSRNLSLNKLPPIVRSQSYSSSLRFSTKAIGHSHIYTTAWPNRTHQERPYHPRCRPNPQLWRSLQRSPRVPTGSCTRMLQTIRPPTGQQDSCLDIGLRSRQEEQSLHQLPFVNR